MAGDTPFGVTFALLKRCFCWCCLGKSHIIIPESDSKIYVDTMQNKLEFIFLAIVLNKILSTKNLNKLNY